MRDQSTDRGGILDSVAARAAGLVMLVVAAYLPAFGGGWLWDDDILITANPLVTEASGLWRIWFHNTSPDYFPVTLTACWIEYRLWGEWAPGYHAVNIVCHAANTVLVWRILDRLGVPGAWLAAAAWGVHPVTVTSVAWVAERKNTLSMFFGCLSVLGWLSYEDSGERRFYGWSLLAFVLALLAKTSLVTLPLILPVLSWWRRGRVTRVDLVRTIPFLGASFVLGLVTLWYQMSHGSGPSAGPLASILASLPRGGVLSGRAVGFYLWKDLWPTKLAMVYGVWPLETSRPVAYLPTLVVAAVIAGLWWRRREPWARAGLFAATVFLLALLPILGFLPATFMKSHGSVADHWQYVALVAPVALFVAVVMEGEERWMPAGAGRLVVAAVVALLGLLTFRHAAIHRTSKGVWTQNLAVVDVWDAHVGLARALSDEGKPAAAIAEAKRAIELYPAATPAWIDLGVIYTGENRYEEAVHAYQIAIDQGGGDDLFQPAGVAAALGGDLARAEVLFARGAAKRPGDGKIRGDWALALEQLGRGREAVARYREVLSIDGDDSVALNALAFLLASRPDVVDDPEAAAAEAVRLARRACLLTSDADPSALDTLATALAAGGEYAAAVEVADRALALATDQADASLVRDINARRALFQAGRPFVAP